MIKIAVLQKLAEQEKTAGLFQALGRVRWAKLMNAARLATSRKARVAARTAAHSKRTAQILSRLHRARMAGAAAERAAFEATPHVSFKRPDLNIGESELNSAWSKGRGNFLGAFKTKGREAEADLKNLEGYFERVRTAERLATDPKQKARLAEELGTVGADLRKRHYLSENHIGGFHPVRFGFEGVLSPYYAYGDAKESYDNFREGNYARGAYHAGLAALQAGIGLGSWGRTLGGINTKVTRGLGSAFRTMSSPITGLTAAGKYGSRGGALKNTARWMERHPWLTAEIAGAPLGVGASPMLLGGVQNAFDAAATNKAVQMIENDPSLSTYAIEAKNTQQRASNKNKGLIYAGGGLAAGAGLAWALSKKRDKKKRKKTNKEEKVHDTFPGA